MCLLFLWPKDIPQILSYISFGVIPRKAAKPVFLALFSLGFLLWHRATKTIGISWVVRIRKVYFIM